MSGGFLLILVLVGVVFSLVLFMALYVTGLSKFAGWLEDNQEKLSEISPKILLTLLLIGVFRMILNKGPINNQQPVYLAIGFLIWIYTAKKNGRKK